MLLPFRNLRLLKIFATESVCKGLLPVKEICRCFHDEFSTLKPLQKYDIQEKVSAAVKTKYRVFKDEESEVIYDVQEEKQKFQETQVDELNETYKIPDISTERGLYGVFDIEDLVDVLRKESAKDIFVCSVPKHIKYVDYMCIVTGRSFRHMLAIAEFVRRCYKIKRHEGDILPRIEGEKSRDWMALDLGNIALHIFSKEAREVYDLETLWSIGPELDKEYNKPKHQLVELFEKNSIFLNDPKYTTH